MNRILVHSLCEATSHKEVLMTFFKIKSLKDSYKVSRFGLVFFGFSLDSNLSWTYKFIRFVIFLGSFLGIGRKMIGRLNYQNNEERLSESKDQAVIFIMLISSCVALVIKTAFYGYQIFVKKKTFKVFSSLYQMDKAIGKFCNSKFSYKRNFLLDFIKNVFLLTLCIVSTVFVAIEAKDGIRSFATSFLNFYGFVIFFLLAFVINLTNEVFLRLKFLNNFLSKQKMRRLSIKHRSETQITIDSVCFIVETASGSIENLCDFFAVEILLILSNS